MDTKNSKEQFIDTVIDQLKTTVDGSTEKASGLTTVLGQYSEALKDYIESKRKYVDLIDKYQTKAPEFSITASMPGVQAALPAFTNDEMVQDSTEMQEIGNLVRELREQLDILEYQITHELGLLVQGVQTIGGLKDQASAYLDQYIDAVSGAYDAGFLASDALL
jgi:uncharacterized protein YggL (DUF469 family)